MVGCGICVHHSRTGDCRITWEKSTYRSDMDDVNFIAVQSISIDKSNLKVIKIIDSFSSLENGSFYSVI